MFNKEGCLESKNKIFGTIYLWHSNLKLAFILAQPIYQLGCSASINVQAQNDQHFTDNLNQRTVMKQHGLNKKYLKITPKLFR